MSSPKAAKTTKNAGKNIGKKSVIEPDIEPTREEKAAFVKAMLHGIEPGSKAAKVVGDKKAGKKPSDKKSAGKKLAAGKSKAGKEKKSAKKNAAAAPLDAGQMTNDQVTNEQADSLPLGREDAGDPRVEILRKISAPEPVISTPKSDEILRLAKEIEQALADGNMDYLQPHAVQALMMALCKFYAANDEADIVYPILPGRLAVSGTDAMVVCGALLRAVDLQVFELGMFQSWSGR